jgi:hypothetical protein
MRRVISGVELDLQLSAVSLRNLRRSFLKVTSFDLDTEYAFAVLGDKNMFGVGQSLKRSRLHATKGPVARE